MVLQREEHPAVPARAGDGARDGGQRLVGPPLPFEAVGGDGDDLIEAGIDTFSDYANDQPTVGGRPNPFFNSGDPNKDDPAMGPLGDLMTECVTAATRRSRELAE